MCALKTLVLLFDGTISFQAGILGIPIYFGLLNLRNGWRVCAIFLVLFGLISLPILFILGVTQEGPANVEVVGINIAQAPSWVVSLETIPFFLLALWQYRVLARPDIRQLFLTETQGDI
jgi:hypothetical protein